MTAMKLLSSKCYFIGGGVYMAVGLGLRERNPPHFEALLVLLSRDEEILLTVEEWQKICDAEQSIISFYNGSHNTVYLTLENHDVFFNITDRTIILKSKQTFHTVRLSGDQCTLILRLKYLAKRHLRELTQSSSILANTYFARIIYATVDRIFQESVVTYNPVFINCTYICNILKLLSGDCFLHLELLTLFQKELCGQILTRIQNLISAKNNIPQ